MAENVIVGDAEALLENDYDPDYLKEVIKYKPDVKEQFLNTIGGEPKRISEEPVHERAILRANGDLGIFHRYFFSKYVSIRLKQNIRNDTLDKYASIFPFQTKPADMLDVTDMPALGSRFSIEIEEFVAEHFGDDCDVDGLKNLFWANIKDFKENHFPDPPSLDQLAHLIEVGSISSTKNPSSASDKNPSPPAGDKNPSPSASDKNPSPSADDKNPSPAASDKNPSPSADDKNPLPSASDENPLPSASDENPSPSASDKNPSPSGGDKNPSPSASDENPSPSASDENPSPSAGDRNPSPSAGVKTPSPSSGDKNPSPSADDRNPSPSAGDKNPLPSASDENHEPFPDCDYLKNFVRLNRGGTFWYQNFLAKFNYACKSYGKDLTVPKKRGFYFRYLPEINCCELLLLLETKFYETNREKYVHLFKKYLFFFKNASNRPNHAVYFIDETLFACLQFKREYETFREEQTIHDCVWALWMMTLVHCRRYLNDSQQRIQFKPHQSDLNNVVSYADEVLEGVEVAKVFYSEPQFQRFHLFLLLDDTAFLINYSGRKGTASYDWVGQILKSALLEADIKRLKFYNAYLGEVVTYEMPQRKEEIRGFVRQLTEIERSANRLEPSFPLKFLILRDLRKYFSKLPAIPRYSN